MMHNAKLPRWAHFQGHHAMALLPALALLLLVAALGVAASEAQTSQR